ncbi:MAG: protein kinase, partial [Deltaproteobacteria bacterium]|nr:protein kinase [Deltaproteobacteria bacterium]
MVRCPRCQRRFPPNGDCAVHGRPSSIVDVAEVEADVVAPDGWKLGRHVATGGTSVVYAVERAGTPAIMKLGRFHQRDVHARFEVEADVLRALGPPNTPAYLEHGKLHDRPYVIMEHVPGETLAAWMSRNGGRGGLGEILALLTRIAAALSALHQAGYVHRDFKPENVMISPKGVRLLDFGLVKPLRTQNQNLTQIGCVVGTVHYLAPEQIRTGGVVDHRADLYSFGVVAFEMLTGQPPFVGERKAIEYQHQVVRPPSIRELREIPQELDDLVHACLAKTVESRPRTAAELQAGLSRALAQIGTLRGVGGNRASANPIKPIGIQAPVVLAMIDGGDPLAITRAITDVQGIVVRQRGEGILAAFTQNHDAPMTVALAACLALVRERSRIVLHTTTALVRRSVQGKQTVYGGEIDQVDGWLPRVPFAGLVLTAAAARAISTGVTEAEIAGFFRVTQREQTDVTDTRGVPTLVGREPIIRTLVGELTASPSVLIGISGVEGSGKTRVIDAIVERLRGAGRDVLALRARRRLAGDRPDDVRLIEALGGGALVGALQRAGARGTIVALDDVQHFSVQVRSALIRPDLGVARIVVSRDPIFEVLDGAAHQIAIELPPLSYPDASSLLRELLRPAHLIPDVLIERLAIRGTGNPALLVALALDIKRRGAVRRHAGGDDWYVAADELDTLLVPPGAEWLAMRALEDLPPELAPLVRMCAALGPRFSADELGAVTRVSDIEARLASLVRDHLMIERNGWYELDDASLQDAIYHYTADERQLVHHRALAYWLANRAANIVGWLARIAHHATGAGEAVIAATSWIALAREASRRGEPTHADALLARATRLLAAQATPVL